MPSYNLMLELADPPDCIVRGLGEGNIRVIIAGSLNANPQMLVRLYGSGKLIVADMLDVRVAGNPGDPRDGRLAPPIPDDWSVGKLDSSHPTLP